ncbi:MAG: hypothetical protein KCHDKBKB_02027 [Elusimicrobia bacterium]|nr:hypothetical protein [Elusimicrobiota bacterium]
MTVVVTTVGGNLPPVANDDVAQTDIASPIDIDVLANDTDPNGNITIDKNSLVLVSGPANGSASVVNGKIRFTPTATTGQFTFTYRVSDILGAQSNIANVTVVVTEVGGNRPPVANDDVAQTDVATAIDIDVLANDTDPNGNGQIDPNSLLVVSGPSNGTASIVNGKVRFTPTATTGQFTFTYRISDILSAQSNIANVTVVVTEVGGNRPPVANDDVAQTDIASPIDIDVLANDTDPNGNITIDKNSLVLVSGPANGSASVVNGKIRFTPTSTTGQFTFTYRVSDILGAQSNIANVTVVVTEVGGNRPPVANDDVAQTDVATAIDIDVLANDTDPNGNITIDKNSLVLVSGPTNGTASIVNGKVRYTPTSTTGQFTFTYRVSDIMGAQSNIANVTVVVTEVGGNRSPVANDDVAQTDVATPIDIDVLANDTDPNGNITIDKNSLVLVSGPTNGTASIVNGKIRFAPTATTGQFTFTYRVSDILGSQSNIANVTVVVTTVGGNLPPVAIDDVAQTDVATPIDIDVLANDTDPNGNITIDKNSLVLVSGPTNGTASIVNGKIRFAPTATTGQFTFTYRVSDILGSQSNIANVTVMVTTVGGNQPPVTNDDVAQTDVATPIDINVLANDTDPNGNITIEKNSLVLVSGPANGSASVVNGKIRFTPTSTTGQFTFTYRVSDILGAQSNVANVTVVVTEVGGNRPPVLDPIGNKTTSAGTEISFTARATDPDEGQSLRFVLVNPPQDAFMDPVTGVFHWTPPIIGSYQLTVKVEDNGTPILSDEEIITIDVLNSPTPIIEVDAGENQQVILPNPVQLIGTLDPILLRQKLDRTDWTMVYGPASAHIMSVNSLATEVHFEKAGLYEFMLNVVREGAEGSDHASVMVYNMPPLDIEEPSLTPINETIELRANLIDQDHVISKFEFSFEWEITGPAPVQLTNEKSLQPLARFETPGTYRVKVMARNGIASSQDSMTIEVIAPPNPQNQDEINYKNFFNPEYENLNLGIVMKENGGNISVKIYDIHGRLIRDLTHETLAAGVQTIVWDGRNDNHSIIAPGIYLVLIDANGGIEKRKVAAIR